MPVFQSRPCSNRSRSNRLKSTVNTQATVRKGLHKFRSGKVIRKFLREKYPFYKTGLKEIDSVFEGQLLKTINARLKKRGAVSVLDWGCGDGTAALELSKNKRLRVYGFSKDGYESFLRSGRVKFIQSTKEALLRYLRRNRLTFDVIYSHRALNKFWGEELATHICGLAGSVNVGGRIIFDGSQITLRGNIDKLESVGLILASGPTSRFVVLRKVK